MDLEKEFTEELIQPCFCGTLWHRTCIRELIVKSEITECPKCSFEYSVGYTECYALFNDKRRNYLRYMLWQEILFFISCLLFAEGSRGCVHYLYSRDSPNVRLQWFVILQVLSGTIVVLAIFLFCARLKAKYTYREIEDIVIYDRTLKEKMDFDSPAILEVYFQELRKYEA